MQSFRSSLAAVILCCSMPAYGAGTAVGPPPSELGRSTHAYHECLAQQIAMHSDWTRANTACAQLRVQVLRAAPARDIDQVLAPATRAIEERAASLRASYAPSQLPPSAGQKVHTAKALPQIPRTPANIALRKYFECVTQDPHYRTSLEHAKHQCSYARSVFAAHLQPDASTRILPNIDRLLMTAWNRASQENLK